MSAPNTTVELVTNSLIRTKLHMPRISNDVIERPHLINRLRQDSARQVTLVSAPAGYGKTTLVTQWLSRENETNGSAA